MKVLFGWNKLIIRTWL